MTESDQELYKNFPMVVSERWQQEVAETVFEAINADTDKIEQKKKQKPRIDDLEEGLYSSYYNQSFSLFIRLQFVIQSGSQPNQYQSSIQPFRQSSFDIIFAHVHYVGNQGPVVQSVVSLMSSLRVISLTVLADSIYNILIFFCWKYVIST